MALLSALNRLGLTGGRCALCANQVAQSTLCPECLHDLRPRTGGFCPECGSLTANEDEPPTTCAMCRIKPPRWTRLHFHGAYEGRLRDMILRFKFARGIELTRLFADMLTKAYEQSGGLADVVVPVPLHGSRLRWRGFNQSLMLAGDVGKRLGLPVAREGLARTRRTRPQTELAPRDRRENIRGAFSMDNGLKGKRVLLVDDVLTTGATLDECSRTLRRYGATGVEVMVVAVAHPDGRDRKK
ncbi:phosphoribosyltransferase family protein [Salidesulfovibrio brasiliensis]